MLVYLAGSPYPVAHYTFTAAGWKTALGNFLLLQDFAVIALPYNVALWTLSIEVFFYLWAPLLARLRPVVTVGLILASMTLFSLRHSTFLYGDLAAHFAWPWRTGAVVGAASRVALPTRARTVLNFLGEQSYPLYLFHLPLGLAFYHYAGLRGYWPLVGAVLLAIPVVDHLCDHWLKNLFWKPLVARLTGLRPVKITSATATNA